MDKNVVENALDGMHGGLPLHRWSLASWLAVFGRYCIVASQKIILMQSVVVSSADIYRLRYCRLQELSLSIRIVLITNTITYGLVFLIKMKWWQ